MLLENLIGNLITHETRLKERKKRLKQGIKKTQWF